MSEWQVNGWARDLPHGLPLYRVIHDRQVVGLTYRLGGVWHAHVVDPSSTTVHHTREAAVESIRRGGWAE